MNEEFIPYEQALALKELGFDEPCLACVDEDDFYLKGDIRFNSTTQPYAPLYQQAFRWFRDNHGLDCSFESDFVEDENDIEIEMWDFFIYKTKQKSSTKVMDFCSNNFNTYVESFSREEAELACLKKLIEIVDGRTN